MLNNKERCNGFAWNNILNNKIVSNEHWFRKVWVLFLRICIQINMQKIFLQDNTIQDNTIMLNNKFLFQEHYSFRLRIGWHTTTMDISIAYNCHCEKNSSFRYKMFRDMYKKKVIDKSLEIYNRRCNKRTATNAKISHHIAKSILNHNRQDIILTIYFTLNKRLIFL